MTFIIATIFLSKYVHNMIIHWYNPFSHFPPFRPPSKRTRKSWKTPCWRMIPTRTQLSLVTTASAASTAVIPPWTPAQTRPTVWPRAPRTAPVATTARLAPTCSKNDPGGDPNTRAPRSWPSCTAVVSIAHSVYGVWPGGPRLLPSPPPRGMWSNRNAVHRNRCNCRD